MDDKGEIGACNTYQEELMDDLRRGPWTVEEDLILYNHIAKHGEGRWNSLARCAGLKRTGKSCRLRWLNYLRPDVKRGNITLEEQLLILELHSQWGNRWSKIAQYLPGRTDNEIKNYWRTRVQKHAKQLKCDVNSKQFKDTMRYLWMPRLAERIQASAGATSGTDTGHLVVPPVQLAGNEFANKGSMKMSYTPENSSTVASSDSFGTQVLPASEYYSIPVSDNYLHAGQTGSSEVDLVNHGIDVQGMEQNNSWLNGGYMLDNSCNVEDYMFLQM